MGNQMANNMLTKSFSYKEVQCRCGCKKAEMKPEFMEVLQKLRDLCGFPLVITSGYRCPRHNKAVGGALNSSHMKGIAVDIDISQMPEERREKLLEAIKSIKEIKGVGIAKSFIHIDTRAEKATWVY